MIRALIRSLALAGGRNCQDWHCGTTSPCGALKFGEAVAMGAFYFGQFHIGQLVSDMVLNLNDPRSVTHKRRLEEPIIIRNAQ